LSRIISPIKPFYDVYFYLTLLRYRHYETHWLTYTRQA